MPQLFCLPTRIVACLIAVVAFVGCSQFGDPHPEQPVDYSHKIHVADNQIACLYCHQTADESPVASVPSVGTCMNCHKAIPGATDAGKKDVEKVRAYWSNQQPIPWNKVHDEPDFVYFTHKRHVRYFMDCFMSKEPGEWESCKLKETAAPPVSPEEDKVFAAQTQTCAQCHGAVWEMGTAQRVEELNMGWCVSCHEKRIEQAPAEMQPVLHGRMLDCWTCHK